jgi:NAD(P)-dependent dehydrogenase (short-subunit alcohol dehydrogenase family)
MNQATGYLANDLAGQQITVNTVVPGLVGTEGAQAWAENMAKQQNVTTEEFLASDRGRYYNGAKIIMDGGLNVNVRPA